MVDVFVLEWIEFIRTILMQNEKNNAEPKLRSISCLSALRGRERERARNRPGLAEHDSSTNIRTKTRRSIVQVKSIRCLCSLESALTFQLLDRIFSSHHWRREKKTGEHLFDNLITVERWATSLLGVGWQSIWFYFQQLFVLLISWRHRRGRDWYFFQSREFDECQMK